MICVNPKVHPLQTFQVDTDEKTRVKNGKKICWNYRKGRCRFGSKCTFAHDSDLHNINDAAMEDKREAVAMIQSSGNGAVEKMSSQSNGRKRPGLSNTIIPSKKVIKQYNLQKK